MIQIESVSHWYGERLVLDAITLDLTEHRIGIVGANGSGKSTLGRLINGLVKPTKGRVSVCGMDTVHQLSKVRSLVGFVFQDPDLQIVMPTVAEDLAFSLRPFRLPKAEVRDRVDAWLERYDLLDHRDHPAHLLSGGQKQLLAVAAILITEPKILVLDEPTTLLDLRNTRRIMEVVSDLDQQVILATHALDSLTDFDRVIVLDQGKVIADANPQTALDTYRHLVDP